MKLMCWCADSNDKIYSIKCTFIFNYSIKTYQQIEINRFVYRERNVESLATARVWPLHCNAILVFSDRIYLCLIVAK